MKVEKARRRSIVTEEYLEPFPAVPPCRIKTSAVEKEQ